MVATTSAFFPRFSAERVSLALKDTPVVMVIGPRQCGKTTLVRQFLNSDRVYITLDDDTVLDATRVIRLGSYVALTKPLSMRCSGRRTFCERSKHQSITAVVLAAFC